MKSTVESLEPTRAKLTVEVDYEDLKPQMDAAYKDIAQQVSIPGFRKGHVPARIIDQRFGRGAVIEQVVNEVLPRFYSQGIVENDLRPLGQPEVDVVEVPATEGEPGGILKFTAEVDVVPSFEIPDFDGLEVEVAPLTVDPADVQTELDELRGRFATLKTLDRAAADGDYLTLDLTATIGEEVIDSLTEVSYELGSGNMLEGQDDALRGASAGDKVTFTSEIRGGERAGETADIAVTVHSVKERELPEADDEFAQMVSEFDTAEELLADLEKQVGEQRRSGQALEARDLLLEKLLAQTEILLPEGVVEHEVSHRVGEDADDEEKQAAKERVEADLRQQLFMESLAEKQKVQVGQQELIDFMIQTSQTYGIDINQMFQDQNQIQNMMAELARTKALVSVLRSAVVKDTNGEVIDISDFTKEQPADEPVFEAEEAEEA